MLTCVGVLGAGVTNEKRIKTKAELHISDVR
jgi:hypothetical protein